MRSIQPNYNLVIKFSILPDNICQSDRLVSTNVYHFARSRNDQPLKTPRLKQVSAVTVTCFGGGAGNESVYAEAVPNGGAGIVDAMEWRCTVERQI